MKLIANVHEIVDHEDAVDTMIEKVKRDLIALYYCQTGSNPYLHTEFNSILSSVVVKVMNEEEVVEANKKLVGTITGSLPYDPTKLSLEQAARISRDRVAATTLSLASMMQPEDMKEAVSQALWNSISWNRVLRTRTRYLASDLVLEFSTAVRKDGKIDTLLEVYVEQASGDQGATEDPKQGVGGFGESLPREQPASVPAIDDGNPRG